MSDQLPPACKRCGKCCLADVNVYITEEDRMRWKEEGRDDIFRLLSHEHALWAGDHLISSEDGSYIHGCIFLSFKDGRFACTIYETRPKTCRNFQPGSSEICPQFNRRISGRDGSRHGNGKEEI